MAKLHNQHNNQIIELLPQHVFGRHSSCHTVLDNLKASRRHATIHWDGDSWTIQDVSSNGSFVNGKLLMRNIEQVLYLNDQIQFASTDNDIWQLIDTQPANSLLMPLSTGAPLIILEDMAALPDETSPQITLYRNDVGRWICESDAGTSTLEDGNTLSVNDLKWRFIEAIGCAKTLDAAQSHSPAPATIYFKVSQDEEHVIMSIKVGEQLFDLGERNHHYLLLLLARQQHQDKTTISNNEEQGWLPRNQLATMLGTDEQHINMQIYRFRKQVIAAIPQHQMFAHVIEKRRGQIRFLWNDIDIQGGLVI